MIGKKRRFKRLFNRQSGKTVIVPIDHAVTIGPAAGLEHPALLIKTLVRSGVEAIIGHKGILKHCHEGLISTPFIYHLSGATCLGGDPGYKALVSDVETAVTMGADAISIHITFGHPQERQMLRDFGQVSSQCDRFGMPLLVMVYLAQTGMKVSGGMLPELHAVRVAEELGADMIKIATPDSNDILGEIVAAAQVPVIVGGGPRHETPDFIQNISCMMEMGIDGVAVGRHVFQSPDMAAALSALHAVVHTPQTASRFRPGS
jgi:DhnA family fructose-bisphosphate aldolase class Ia